ncbi:hypothetical protein FRB90_008801 [Tulasnella sp. 427]|nr:hypothetical protein FRB90_008801 [Tulasnella sp. 427]
MDVIDRPSSFQTILGYIPGHIHGFWLIYKKHKAEKLYGPGGWAYQGNGQFVPATRPAAVGPGYGTM